MLTIYTEERRPTNQLVVVELRSAIVHCEPPSGGADCRCSDIATDRHVAEEEPVANERFPGAAWRLVHDLQVRRVEAERGGWQAVCYQIDPEQLDGDQSFGHTQSGSQEDTDDLQQFTICSLPRNAAMLARSWKS